MSSYPSGNRILEPLSQSIRAGIIAGACFLTSALLISLLVSYLMKLRRARRMENSPIFFSRYQKASNFERSESPDSLLKFKLETALYETFEHDSVSRRRSSGEKHAQYETHLGSLESIQRGPDGRFVMQRQPGLQLAPLVPHFEASPTRAKSDACPQIQGVRVSAPLRAKARGQARGRPRACYFAMASSSPTDGSHPPFIPDLSPIPRPLVCEPSCRPVLSDGNTGLSARPSHSLLELASIVAGDRGLTHGVSWPGPLETADPGHLPTGLAFEPTRVGPSGIPRGSNLPGGCGATSVSGLERCRPQARPNPEFPRDRGPSFAPSEVPGSSPAPNSSGYHSADASRRASEERSSDRRDFLAGEQHKWDEGLTMNSEILEALKPHQRPRRPISSIALQDLALTGSSMSSDLRRSGTVQSLEVLGGVWALRQSRSSTESRCAALREEFQEYRRRKEREQSEGAQGKDLSRFGNLEQATLL
ncbi:protein turtle homolog A-like [Scyliorhinus canicula]|uniref:protein turtle homolog A-like n=1 Tax=Scyliorhinus canicula TaxID=7830 RepID=UPI0018F3B960|nr:protein turtle homolog A-like [Scyliorhinus canicula]